MEITTREFKHAELIAVTGRVDSMEAVQLAKALESARRRGIHKIIVDMSQLEYMSSAGFRALGEARRNSQRHPGGEVVLVQVPSAIREALDLVGFSDFFRMEDSVTAALASVENLPAGDSPLE